MGWNAAFCRRNGDASFGAAEAGGGQTPFVGVGTGRGEGEFDPTRAPDRAAGHFGELGVGKTDAPDSADENIGERGEPQPELGGAHRCRKVRSANRSPWQICATMRATSSTEPALASMFHGLSLAARRCRPQNTYRGR